ncbi:restriction endonuclease [Aureimonas sp. SA4125]|uniref:restriction endonuclease n=1 Tax=Aureimonas sp. SA4125 TaxID=2826993 RepID=UPI001CC47A14|nr:restriction endonuclease [Aureimonas sp. SA4125]BDA83987.1 restriction endonuclease [Aureimonas sp. SA4125]
MTADIPRTDSFYRFVIVALDAMGGSGSVSEIDDRVAADLKLGQDMLDQTYKKTGVAIVADHIAWAPSYLKIAGLADNPSRGIWILIDDGRKALGVDDRVLRRVVSEAAKARAKKEGGKAIAEDRHEILEANGPVPRDEASPLWSDRPLAILLAIKPDAFERLCQRVLRESGFTKVDVTGRSGDGGIDGSGVLRMNLVSFTVQCKRWQGSVGSGVVRDFRGAMVGRSDKGLIITTSTFTADARREATRAGAPAINLVDGETLCDLLRC